MVKQKKHTEIEFLIPRTRNGMPANVTKTKTETETEAMNDEVDADIVAVTTDRPDQLFGATFISLPPSHFLAVLIMPKKLAANKPAASDHFSGAYATNPLSNEKLPVWISSYAGDKPHLGVPAHNQTDHDFAQLHGLPIRPVIAQDFGAPLPDAKDVAGVVVIGYDPKTKQFMGLKNGSQGWLVGGGREEDETFESAACRELDEEAGFSEVLDLVLLGDPVYSYYYNDIKRSNRRSLAYNYLAIVDRERQGVQRQEAHESFVVWWTNFDELYADIKKTGGGVQHWLDALCRAKAAAEAHDAGRQYQSPLFTGEGTLVNSGRFDGLTSEAARTQIINELATNDGPNSLQDVVK